MLGFREFVGATLMIIGLGLIGVVLIMALNRNVMEALALSLPSVIVFRAGVGFLRMSTAARLAMKFNREK